MRYSYAWFVKICLNYVDLEQLGPHEPNWIMKQIWVTNVSRKGKKKLVNAMHVPENREAVEL